MKTKKGKKALIALLTCMTLVVGVIGVSKLMLDAGISVTTFDHFGLSEDDQGNLWQYYYNDDSDELNVALYSYDETLTDFAVPATFTQCDAGVTAGNGHEHSDALATAAPTDRKVVLNSLLDMPAGAGGGGGGSGSGGSGGSGGGTLPPGGTYLDSAPGSLNSDYIAYQEWAMSGPNAYPITFGNFSYIDYIMFLTQSGDGGYNSISTSNPDSNFGSDWQGSLYGLPVSDAAVKSLLYSTFYSTATTGTYSSWNEFRTDYVNTYSREYDPKRWFVMQAGEDITSVGVGEFNDEYILLFSDSRYCNVQWMSYITEESYNNIIYAYETIFAPRTEEDVENWVAHAKYGYETIEGETDEYGTTWKDCNYFYRDWWYFSTDAVESIEIGDTVYTNADDTWGALLDSISNAKTFSYYAYKSGIGSALADEWSGEYPENYNMATGLNYLERDFDEDDCDVILNLTTQSYNGSDAPGKIGLVFGGTIGNGTWVQVRSDFFDAWVGTYFLWSTDLVNAIRNGTGDYSGPTTFSLEASGGGNNSGSGGGGQEYTATPESIGYYLANVDGTSDAYGTFSWHEWDDWDEAESQVWSWTLNGEEQETTYIDGQRTKWVQNTSGYGSHQEWVDKYVFYDTFKDWFYWLKGYDREDYNNHDKPFSIDVYDAEQGCWLGKNVEMENTADFGLPVGEDDFDLDNCILSFSDSTVGSEEDYYLLLGNQVPHLNAYYVQKRVSSDPTMYKNYVGVINAEVVRRITTQSNPTTRNIYTYGLTYKAPKIDEPEYTDEPYGFDLSNVDIIADTESVQDILDKSATVSLADGAEIADRMFTGRHHVDVENLENVSKIGVDAFNGCWFVDPTVTFTQLTELGTGAFANTNLVSVDLGPTFTNLSGVDANGNVYNSQFAHCGYLVEFNFDHIERIGRTTFWDCGFTNVQLPATTLIDWGGFYECQDLVSVSMPDVTSIGASAFRLCNNLTDIEFGEDLTEICDYAFAECTSLQGFSLEDTQVSILGQDCFNGCTSLVGADVNLGPVEYLGYECFKRCTNLDTFDLQNVKWVGQWCFNYCELNEVDLGEVAVVGYQAFNENKFTELYLPSSICVIEQEAFQPANKNNIIDVTIAFNIMGTGLAENGADDLDVTWAYADEDGNPLDPETTDFTNPVNRMHVVQTGGTTMKVRRGVPTVLAFGEYFGTFGEVHNFNVTIEANDATLAPEGTQVGYEYTENAYVRSIDTLYGHGMCMLKDQYDLPFGNSRCTPGIYYDNDFGGVNGVYRELNDVDPDKVAYKNAFLVQGAGKAYNKKGTTSTVTTGSEAQMLAAGYTAADLAALPFTWSASYDTTAAELLEIGYTQEQIDAMDSQMSNSKRTQNLIWDVDTLPKQYDANGVEYDAVEYNERAGITGYDLEKAEYLETHKVPKTAELIEEITGYPVDSRANHDILQGGQIARDENGEYYIALKNDYVWVNGAYGGYQNYDERYEFAHWNDWYVTLMQITYNKVYEQSKVSPYQVPQYYPANFVNITEDVNSRAKQLYDTMYDGLSEKFSCGKNYDVKPTSAGGEVYGTWDRMAMAQLYLLRLYLTDEAYFVERDAHDYISNKSTHFGNDYSYPYTEIRPHETRLIRTYYDHRNSFAADATQAMNTSNSIRYGVYSTLDRYAEFFGWDYDIDDWDSYVEWETANIMPIETAYINGLDALAQEYGFADWDEYEQWQFDAYYNNPNFTNNSYDVNNGCDDIGSTIFYSHWDGYYSLTGNSAIGDYPGIKIYPTHPSYPDVADSYLDAYDVPYYNASSRETTFEMHRLYAGGHAPRLDVDKKIWRNWRKPIQKEEWGQEPLYKHKCYNVTVYTLASSNARMARGYANDYTGTKSAYNYDTELQMMITDVGYEDHGIIPPLYFCNVFGDVTIPEGFTGIGYSAFRRFNGPGNNYGNDNRDQITLTRSVSLPSTITVVSQWGCENMNTSGNLTDIRYIGYAGFCGDNNGDLSIDSEALEYVCANAFHSCKLKKLLLPENLKGFSMDAMSYNFLGADEFIVDCDFYGDLKINHYNESYSESPKNIFTYKANNAPYGKAFGSTLNWWSSNQKRGRSTSVISSNQRCLTRFGNTKFTSNVIWNPDWTCNQYTDTFENYTMELATTSNHSSKIQDINSTFYGMDFDKLDLSETGLETLPIGLFRNCHVGELILPDTLTSINALAFDGAVIDEVLKIPAGVTRLGANAFFNSNVKADFSDCHLEYIGPQAFMNTRAGFTKLTVYEDTEFYASSFQHSNYVTPAKELRIEQSLDPFESKIYVGDYSAQYSTSNFKYLHKDLNDHHRCSPANFAPWLSSNLRLSTLLINSGIEKLTFGPQVTQLQTGYDWSINNGEGNYYGSAANGLGGSEFYNVAVKEVEFEGLKYLPNFAFEGNTTIQKVTLSDDIECIGFQAFNGATSLQVIDLPATENPILIMPNAFENTGIESIVNREFINGAELDDSESGTNTTNWNVDFDTPLAATFKANPAQAAFTGLTLMTKDDWAAATGDIVIQYKPETYDNIVAGTPVNDVYATNGSKDRADWDAGDNHFAVFTNGQFNNCNALKKVGWGNNLGNIPDRIFESCANLKDVEVSKYLENIGQDAFKWCNSLEKFVFWGIETHVDDENVIAGNVDGVADPSDMTIPMFCDIWCYSTAETIAHYMDTYVPLQAGFGVDVGDVCLLDEVLYQETQGTQVVAPGEPLDFSNFNMGTLRRDAVVMESDGLEELSDSSIYTGGKKFGTIVKALAETVQSHNNATNSAGTQDMGNGLVRYTNVFDAPGDPIVPKPGYKVPAGIDLIPTPWTIAELPDVSNFDSVTSDYDPTDLTLGDRLVTFTYIDRATGNPVTSTVTITVVVKYDIEFQNWDGSSIGTYLVANGLQPVAPTEIQMKPKTGHHFVEWEDVATGVRYTSATIPVATADTVYRAVFTKNIYTIRWQDWDGTILKTENVPYQDAPLAPDVPAREGFKHTGWTPVISVATQDVTYTTLWDRNTYLVTFVDHDNSVISQEPVEHGAMPVPPANPTWIGHTFKGWTPVVRVCTEAATYRAVYEIDTFNIRWLNRDGSVIDTTLVPYGEMPVPPAPPAWIGHTLTGWTPVIVPATEDTSYTTVWDVNTFDIQFVDYDGSVLSNQVVAYGNMPVVPEVGHRPGFVFTGFTPEVEAATKNQVYVATYIYKECTVTFVDWDDTVLGTDTVLYGMSAVAPVIPTRDGYTFTGWDKPLTNIIEDTTIKALYTEDAVVGPPAVVYTIKGTVEFNNAPEKDIDIAIGGAANLSASTGEDGKFLINTPVAGDYTITVSKGTIFYTGTLTAGNPMKYADVSNNGRYTVSVEKSAATLDYKFSGAPAPAAPPGGGGGGKTDDPPEDKKDPPKGDDDDDDDPPGDEDTKKSHIEDDGTPTELEEPMKVSVRAIYNGEPLVGVLVEFYSAYSDSTIETFTDDMGKIAFVVVETGDYGVYVHETSEKSSPVVSSFMFTVEPDKTTVTDKYKAQGYRLKLDKKGRNLNADVDGENEEDEEEIDIPEEENKKVPKTGDEIWIIFLLLIISTFISLGLYKVRKCRTDI